ncbi:MAG: tRNA uridine-5-carboxymethylaminomethyl(34) synthesis GTPase MnmE [Ignavibacteriaceae bacterium]
MSNSFTEDTIVALATPYGTGAISVIRVSGVKSLEAVDKIFKGKKKIVAATTHTIHYGKIADNKENFIDDVLVSIFRSPNSYTGEDSIEISTHGNPLISKKIIELLCEQNIRLAEPGEFTKRAFLNNRLDLSQAEAVADVINARTDASLKGARNQLDGLLSQKVHELKILLINASSFVELELDFAEENIEFINHQELLIRIEKIISEINSLLDTYFFGKVIKDGVNVALVGKPNVGKSSLLNYIVKESRAIVSSIPGTTRDVIREEVSIGGVLFRLHDTAGIHLSRDEIEKEGIFRSQETVKNSDIIILIGDIEQEISPEFLDEIISLAPDGKIIKIINKIDLTKKSFKNADICVSALTGQGMDILFKKLVEISLGTSVYSEKSAVVSNLRHFLCLKYAKESLQSAVDSIKTGLSGEFIAVDLRNAESKLGEIIGEITSEDILNNIFMKFCIGK